MHEHEAGGPRGRCLPPAVYVVDKTTSEIVKAPDPNTRELRHQRTALSVKEQMRSKVWCLYPLGITRWGEHDGTLWHKQGRKHQ